MCPERYVSSAALSKLLFEARELVEMFADIVEARAGVPDKWSRRVVEELDRYRRLRGWSPDGFGHENDHPDLVVRMEFTLWGGDTRDADLTRMSEALSALEAQGVIKSAVQLGHRSPYPDEVDGEIR